MKEMKINTRQICFIMLAYTAAAKLLLYPTILSQLCGRDLLFPAALSFLTEGIVIWSVAYLCSRTDKTFYGLLQNALGTVVARIIYGLFALFFLMSALVPVFEQKQYVHNIFYDTVPSIGIFLPFFVFAAYAASKKLINIGRCADVCLPIFAVCMLFLFAMAIPEVEWDNFLPVLKTPAKSIFGGYVGTAFNFAEPCWLLMLMGHFKYKKGDAARITLSYAGGAAFVLVFLAVFYGMYGAVAPSRTFAVARTSLFFPAIETLGRIDLIILLTLEMVMLFALALNIQLSVHCISKCVDWNNYMVLSFIVNAVLMIVIIVCDSSYNSIYRLYYRWSWLPVLVFTVLIPLAAWALKRRKRE